MEDLRIKINELNSLIGEFRFHEALDRFYNENIVIHENENPPMKGLRAYHEGATQYLGNISNASAELMNVIVSEGITVTEWRYVFDHKVWGHWDKVQISVQRWSNGKIVHERHHYAT